MLLLIKLSPIKTDYIDKTFYSDYFMKKNLLIPILCLSINACSFTTSSKEQVTSKPSDELEFTVDTYEEAAQPLEIKADVIAKNEDKEEVMIEPKEPRFRDYQKNIANVSKPEVIETTELIKDKPELYHIEKNDTLMMVSFKIYGDYRKWKDIRNWNKEKVKSKLVPGDVLKYFPPEQKFVWNPQGNPYLVKTGDTLQLVSKNKYGTNKKWRIIFENNRPLIRNPNLLFAGFTIYYIPDRNIASERR
jgi:nucleoid-associated protein YgaU